MQPITHIYDSERELKLDLYLPETERPPIFIYMHGGGLEAGDRTGPRVLFDKLCSDGIAVASLDYRMYPDARFPDYIEDCARAIDYVLHRLGLEFSGVYVGGSSAGAYLSMMLLFDSHYLKKYDLDPLAFDGWVLDAGQPTVHFNVLRERGLDTRLVRLDEAAPLWHITSNFAPAKGRDKLPMILNLAASSDMACRLEQLKLLDATLKHFGWPADRLRFMYMNGWSHCGYDGAPVFAELIESIITR